MLFGVCCGNIMYVCMCMCIRSACVCVCVCARARVRACVCVCVCGSATQLAGIHVPSSQIPASWGARARDADGTSAHDQAPRHGRTPAPASSLPSPTAPTPDPPPPPRPLRTSRSRTKEELSHQCASAPARPRAFRSALCVLRFAFCGGARKPGAAAAPRPAGANHAQKALRS